MFTEFTRKVSGLLAEANSKQRTSFSDLIVKFINRRRIGVVESFADFAQDTTAHGVKFFFQGKKLSRVCFFVVWLAAVVYTCWTCYKGIADYNSHPTGTKFEISRSEDINIAFPTISLCNINKIRKDYLEHNQKLKTIYDLFNKLESPELLAGHENVTDVDEHSTIIEELRSFKDDEVINTTVDSIYREGGPSDNDILTCKIGYKDCAEVFGEKFFQRVVSHQGNCFKINPNGLLQASVAGNLGGLSLFLHSQHNQYSLVRLTEPSEGFKITFHDHLAEGNVGNTGFVVSPGLQYFIQLSYKETNLLQKPYGQGGCMADVNYRMSTCTNDCIQRYIIKSCDCRPFAKHHELDAVANNTRLCTLIDMFSCVLRKHSQIVQNKTLRAENCIECGKACQFKLYEHSVSSSLLSNSFIEKLLKIYSERQTRQAAEEAKEAKNKTRRGKRALRWRNKSPETNSTGSLRGRLVDLVQQRIVKWSTDMVKENVVILKISFPSIEKHTVNQVISYGFGNLLGDIGGVLGLFLGGSVFTVLEFLDYFVRMIHENIANFRAKKKKEYKKKEREQQERILNTLSKHFLELNLEEVEAEQEQNGT